MRAEAFDEGLSDAVAFMTNRRLHCCAEGSAGEGDCRAWAIATVGLSNALRAGDSVGGPAAHGTINLLVCLTRPLTVDGALEGLCLAGEAKTLAVRESGTHSIVSQLPASGTGTDYLAIAWPAAGAMTPWAGKHTAAGAAIDGAAFAAVAQGIVDWHHEHGGSR
jgi:adenosylcobinamide amidohydrolase